MKNVSDHANAMHKGPHHDMYIHEQNRSKGNNKLGNTSHLENLKGMPKGDDVVGHSGKMKW